MKRTVLMAALIAVAPAVFAESVHDVLARSVVDKNQATVDRIEQDDVQRFCSKPRTEMGDMAEMQRIREASMKAVKMPSDGVFLGDWKRGADIANNGKGLQYSDDPNEPNGGNCYACHQLDPREVAYGTIGPSLKNYGMRGQSDVVLQYTWTKIYDTHAYNTCSHMPRFGANGILTEEQIKDIVAYLLDPESPVNVPLEDGEE